MNDSINIDEQDARMWGSMCHFSALAGYLFPFANIIVPVIIWRTKGKDHPFIDEQGREALNFQITMTIYTIISIILMLVVIGLFLLAIVAIAEFILVIVAGIKARDGISFRYPLTIRFF